MAASCGNQVAAAVTAAATARQQQQQQRQQQQQQQHVQLVQSTHQAVKEYSAVPGNIRGWLVAADSSLGCGSHGDGFHRSLLHSGHAVDNTRMISDHTACSNKQQPGHSSLELVPLQQLAAAACSVCCSSGHRQPAWLLAWRSSSKHSRDSCRIAHVGGSCCRGL
jgi:hypothetical protein